MLFSYLNKLTNI